MNIVKIITLLITSIITISCSVSDVDKSSSHWILTDKQRDSVTFSKYHYYNVGYNFVVSSDSIKLTPLPDGWPLNLEYSSDTTSLTNGEDFVVTEIFKPSNFEEIHTDSVWLRIGSDGKPLGWISENELLDNSTPVYPISRFIHAFSGHHIYLLYVVLIIITLIYLYNRFKGKHIRIIHFNDINSVYPTAYSICIATAAMVYATIQLFFTSTWIKYYYNPSLNPLNQPMIISVFLVLVWLSIILLLSVIYDILEKLSFGECVSYLVALTAWSGIIYVAITLLMYIYIGYLIYIIYVVFAIYRYYLTFDRHPHYCRH